MPVRALTLDFWNTMVVARTNGRRRQQQRMERLAVLVRRYRPDATDALIAEAYQEARRRFDVAWKEQHLTPTTTELVHHVWEALDLVIDDAEHAELVAVFEEGLLHGPPHLAEGLTDILPWAAERYRLGIISDTMFSPGRVIRRLLDQHGMLHYFDAFVFSDEVGFSKPDTRAFERAAGDLGVPVEELAHIGDLRRTDIAGARAAGARALLFTGVQPDADLKPEPDAVLPAWHHLPEILEPLT